MADPNIWSPSSSATLIRETAELFKGTSVTSNTIADTGTLTFDTQTYLYFEPQMWLLIADAASAANWMVGQVVTYDPATGELVFAPVAKAGSGTLTNWGIYLTGAYLAQVWNGGTVANPSTFESAVTLESTLAVAGESVFSAQVGHNAPVLCTTGDMNLVTTITLADANAALTAAQTFNTNLIISPTADRTITLPTAAAILAILPGYVVGSHYSFTIVNKTDQKITILGNTGVVLQGIVEFQEGSATYEISVTSPTVVTVVNTASPVVRSGVSDISTGVVVSSSSDIVLASNSVRLQSIAMSVEGQSYILPPATSMPVAHPSFVLANRGFYPVGIKDNTGQLLGVIEAGSSVTVSLITNTTVAGVWVLSGNSITGGLIQFHDYLAVTYGVAELFNLQLKLTESISVHFAEITSNGLAVFVVDHANKVLGTPASVTTTAGTRPRAVFKISDTSFILFYSATSAPATLHAVVIELAGTTPTLNAVSTLTVASSDIGDEDGIGIPRIAQLDTTLYSVVYRNSSNYVVGCQISSGVTVTWGTPVVLVGGSIGFAGGAGIFNLTTTTALILYKTGASTPYQGKAVVVSITNATPPVCTLGTEVNTMASKTVTTPSACVKLSSTVFALADNNNLGSPDLYLMGVQVTGIAVAVSAATLLVANANSGYSDNGATRFCPKLARLSDTSLAWWGVSSGSLTKFGVVSLVFPTITTGTYFTSSSGVSGMPLAFGETHFISGHAVNSGGSGGVELVIVPHKMESNVMTTGKPFKLPGIFNPDFYTAGITEHSLTATYLGSGIYAILVALPTVSTILSGSYGLCLIATDGITIKNLGTVDLYLTAYAGGRGSTNKNYLTALDSRLVLLGSDSDLVGADTTQRLRVTVVDTIA